MRLMTMSEMVQVRCYSMSEMTLVEVVPASPWSLGVMALMRWQLVLLHWQWMSLLSQKTSMALIRI